MPTLNRAQRVVLVIALAAVLLVVRDQIVHASAFASGWTMYTPNGGVLSPPGAWEPSHERYLTIAFVVLWALVSAVVLRDRRDAA